jgi:hypothetical protein
MFNSINKKKGKNEIYLDGTMLHKLFDDDKDHFIVVEKDGKEIAIGFFRGLSSPTSDRVEILVTAHPHYKEWLEHAKNNPLHPLNTVKGAYLDLSSGTVIKELEFPKEWTSTLALVEMEAAVAQSAS